MSSTQYTKKIALVDCNSFYVSCERLFNPNNTDAYLVNEGILPAASPKILDTSVIIDGRINGLLSCGLLEGQLIVAQSVIDE